MSVKQIFYNTVQALRCELCQKLAEPDSGNFVLLLMLIATRKAAAYGFVCDECLDHMEETKS